MSARRLAALALIVLATGCTDAGGATDRPGKVGVVETLFTDAARARPLATRVWYPAAADAVEQALDYERAFRGFAAPVGRALGHGLTGTNGRS